MVKLITPREEINPNPSKVGQAVYDILSKPYEAYEVGEIINEYSKKYTEEVKEAIKNGLKNFESPFYILVLHKKEFWTDNVLRNWFVSRQTRPLAADLRREYPNHGITLYSYDGTNGHLKILYSLPTAQDSKTIMKNAHLYDPQLVEWIKKFNEGRLDPVSV